MICPSSSVRPFGVVSLLSLLLPSSFQNEWRDGWAPSAEGSKDLGLEMFSVCRRRCPSSFENCTTHTAPNDCIHNFEGEEESIIDLHSFPREYTFGAMLQSKMLFMLPCLGGRVSSKRSRVCFFQMEIAPLLCAEFNLLFYSRVVTPLTF